MRTTPDGRPSRLSLCANFSWTFLGNITYAACQWGMLVVLAKLGSPRMVGEFALGLAITAPIMAFACLSIREVQATDAKREYSFGSYFGLRLSTTVVALVLLVGIVLVSSFDQETRLIVLAVGLGKAVESISDVFYGLLQSRERMDRVAISMIVRGILSVSVLGVAVHLTQSVFWGAIGMAGAWAFVLIGYDMPNCAWALRSEARTVPPEERSPDQEEGLRPNWKADVLARLAWTALPLGLVLLLESIFVNIPRYFVAKHMGEAMLGIFAALAYIERAGKLVVHALGRSSSPRLSVYYAAGNGKGFRTLLFKTIGMGALIGGAIVLVTWAGGDTVLTLIYRSEYARQDVLIRLMVAAAMSYITTFLVYGLTAARYFRVQLYSYLLVTGVVTLSSAVLIPSQGLLGAANVFVIARGVEVVLMAGITASVLRALGSSSAALR